MVIRAQCIWGKNLTTCLYNPKYGVYRHASIWTKQIVNIDRQRKIQPLNKAMGTLW